MTKITMEQREAIVREAVASRDALLAEVALGPYLCIAPACGSKCSDCNSAISPDNVRKNAVRYALLQRTDPRFGMPADWLRFRTLDEAVDSELAKAEPSERSDSTGTTK